MKLSTKEREHFWNELSENPPKVLVVGGGVVGASVAAHLGMAGVSCALVEQNDFSSGTSQSSTGLAHAGLRYLVQGRILYVLQEARERLRLQKIAPHLVKVFPFVFPVYEGKGFSLSITHFGTWLYQFLYRIAVWLEKMVSIQNYQLLSKDEVLERLPKINRESLMGGLQYFVDAQLDDARFTWEFVELAASKKVPVLNYVKVMQTHRQDNGKWKVTCLNMLNQKEIHFEVDYVINCTGPWINDLSGEQLVLKSRGTHLLVDRLSDLPLIANADDHGRVFFVLPYGSKWSLVGTTDVQTNQSPDETRPTESEIAELKKTLKTFFPSKVKGEELKIHQVYWGVRPLGMRAGNVSAISRDHQIVFSDQPGLWSIPGVKLTAARKVGEEVACLLVELLEQRSCFSIPFSKLPGGEFESEEGLFDELKEMNAQLHLSDLKYFVGRYGKSSLQLMRLTLKNKELRRRVEPDEPWILAEVVYCARYEMVMTLNDFLWRRARWARFKNLSPKTVELVGKYLAQELRWSTKRLQSEIQSYQTEFAKTQINLNH